MPKRKIFSSKRSKPSYFMSVVGVALVLFLLGILGLIVIHAERLSKYFKENIEVQVILQNNTASTTAIALRDSLRKCPFTKSAEYVSKEMAADRFKKDFGEDFISLLQYNPLYASVNLKANAAYVNPDSLKRIEKTLLQNTSVKEVYYQRALVSKLSDNVRKIGAVILAISIILCIVVIVLIDNTIRLSMFSNRFLIKTMQMVGATRGFISRPMNIKAVVNGAISGAIAITAIWFIILFMEGRIPELKAIHDDGSLIMLF